MADLDFTRVTMRLGVGVSDGPDADTNPDVQWCTGGTIKLTPLASLVKVVGATPPFTLGLDSYVCTIDSEGYLTYRDQRSVSVIDLTSEKVNPRFVGDTATHEVTFLDVQAGELSVDFPTFPCRITGQASDLTAVSPVSVIGATPIVRGAQGVGISAATVQNGELLLTLTDGAALNAGKVPPGPKGEQGPAGGSDAETAQRVDSGPLTKTALTAATASRFAGRELGWQMWVLIGQSNIAGRGVPFSQVTDPPNPDVLQIKGKAPNKGTAVPAVEPLDHVETPTGIGPGYPLVRNLITAGLVTGQKPVLIPCAQGGTPLVRTATPTWNPTAANSLYANVVAQIAAARAAAPAGSKVAGILWGQGESDGDLNVAAADYAALQDQLLTGVRAACGDPTGATIPVYIVGMVPEYLGTGTRRAIDYAQADTGNRLPNVYYVPGAVDGNLGDGNHYAADGVRRNAAAVSEAHKRVTSGLPYKPRYPTGAPILDQLGVPAYVAHGMRLLASTYAGPCLKVRRSIDGLTLDVGFFRGVVDADALVTFAQGGDLFVDTFYDQSGNARHWTQATAANQAQIVKAGRLIQAGDSGIPMPTGGPATFYFRAGAGLLAAGSASLLTVIRSTGAGLGGGVLFAETATNYPNAMYRMLAQSGAGAQLAQYGAKRDAAAFLPATSHTSPVVPFSPFNGMVRQLSIVDTGIEYRKYLDGTLIGTVATSDRVTLDGSGNPVNDMGGQSLFAQARSAATVANFWPGAIPEHIAFPSALSDAVRAIGRASQRAFYGAV